MTDQSKYLSAGDQERRRKEADSFVEWKGKLSAAIFLYLPLLVADSGFTTNSGPF
jgi:hypothetical protein